MGVGVCVYLGVAFERTHNLGYRPLLHVRLCCELLLLLGRIQGLAVVDGGGGKELPIRPNTVAVVVVGVAEISIDGALLRSAFHSSKTNKQNKNGGESSPSPSPYE